MPLHLKHLHEDSRRNLQDGFALLLRHKYHRQLRKLFAQLLGGTQLKTVDAV